MRSLSLFIAVHSYTGKLSNPSSPNPMLTITSYLGQNVGLREGLVAVSKNLLYYAVQITRAVIGRYP